MKTGWWMNIGYGCLFLGWAFYAPAGELARFEVREPLGQTWHDEWLSQKVLLQLGERRIRVGDLKLLGAGQVEIPAQYYITLPKAQLLSADELLTGLVKVQILFRASVPQGQVLPFTLRDEPGPTVGWQALTIESGGGNIRIHNGVYELVLDGAYPIRRLGRLGTTNSLVRFSWPANLAPTSVADEWIERGPVRVILKRSFRFANPGHRYQLVLDMRAGDPWLDLADEYALGKGSALEVDLRPMAADRVYHPYAYNARTYQAGGDPEDSTLQPPQHPVATLGPVWRDIWYNGGPFAFIYNSQTREGLGVATVRGSEWKTPEGITPESQNLEVHGHPQKPGQVYVRVPADGGSRRWALIMGPPEIRTELGRLTRSHADMPLDKIRQEWVLEWASRAPEFKAGAAGVYLAGYYNQHFFNPTTFPRNVRAQLEKAFELKQVKSRDLAVLAYVFTDPNYWPGPAYPWQIGNPNFHTDMYNIPLKIGLLMPDHPHARRWLNYGVRETYDNLQRSSFPGGAWTESISYAGYFFQVAENIQRLREFGVTNGFQSWPRVKDNAIYLALMHTPVDPRYGARQKAPIGDTSPGNYAKELHQLGEYFRGVDPIFAERLARFPQPWLREFDLGSRSFPGFGAMLRGNAYDERHESFVTVKAGPARHHFQGDEQSFHFCGLGTPLAIDHACHYSPRPWSVAMHNRPDMNQKSPVAVAELLAFKPAEVADFLLAEEKTTRISEVPMEPHHAIKPGWEYPVRRLDESQAWKMRRFVMLVKHDPARSRLPDYLVVQDEIASPEPVGWNLHVLGREIQELGASNRFHFPGQLDVDLTAHFLGLQVLQVEKRQWGWSGPSGTRRTLKGADYEAQCFGRFIPEDFKRGSWTETDGERTMWLRVLGPAGRTGWFVVLMPNLRGKPAPTVERLTANSARIQLGDEIETVYLGTASPYPAAVEQGGTLTCLLEPKAVPDF